MIKKNILVLGSTGLIGHQIYNHLVAKKKYNLYNFSYRKKLTDDSLLVDARNEESFFKKIKDISPDIIINAIGVLIDGANLDPENAIFLNAFLPHRLRKFSDSINAKLIHISTDCVFSGKKGTPYLEADFKDGEDIYAKTKGLGEIIYDNHLTLRTSVVGPELKSDGEELFHWFMNQTGCIEGYTKSIWSGVTTIELAKAVEVSIEKDINGLHHVTNNMSINKYDLLKLFKKYTQKDIVIKKVDGRDTNKSFLDTRRELAIHLPSYEEMVRDMIDLIKKEYQLYSQYRI